MRFLKIFLLFSFLLCFQTQAVNGFLEKVDNLEYVVRKIDDPPIDRLISKRFDLYELYFENRSDKTFSIPGYSINLGVDYSPISEVLAVGKNKSAKKFAVLNIAAGAASIAFSGIARSAANTAIRSVAFKKNNSVAGNEKGFLSENRTYIIYPNDSLSLFFFLDKFNGQSPTLIRYICRDEVQNINYVVINGNLNLQDTNANSDSNKNVIAVPDSNQYK